MVFAECGLTFKGRSGLLTFKIHKKSGRPFTPVVVDKTFNKPPGKLHYWKPTAKVIQENGKVVSVRSLKAHPNLNGSYLV